MAGTGYLQRKVLEPDCLAFVGAVPIDEVGCVDNDAQARHVCKDEGLAVVSAPVPNIWLVKGN